jgi:hypothetical protein
MIASLVRALLMPPRPGHDLRSRPAPHHPVGGFLGQCRCQLPAASLTENLAREALPHGALREGVRVRVLLMALAGLDVGHVLVRSRCGHCE